MEDVKSKIEISNKAPRMTSQFDVCVIPLAYDTYIGCSFACQYCFAWDILEYMRKVSCKGKDTSFSRIVGHNPEYLRKWLKRTMDGYGEKAERVAIRERIPIKIGSNSDPFPYIEREQRITYETLKVFHEYDYPVQMSTKNPIILSEYAHEFKNPNWVVNVTMISSDEEFRRKVEPCSPTLTSRLRAIKKLTELGIPVMVRVQPIIYPYILDKLEPLLESIKEAGAFGIMMEGLKMKKCADTNAKNRYKNISDAVGYDVVKWFRENGVTTKSDYEYKLEDKMIYIAKAKELCDKIGLTFYSGDNECRGCGAGRECCGTSCLRNHKTMLNCEAILDCKVDFTRACYKLKEKPTIRQKLIDYNSEWYKEVVHDKE